MTLDDDLTPDEEEILDAEMGEIEERVGDGADRGQIYAAIIAYGSAIMAAQKQGARMTEEEMIRSMWTAEHTIEEIAAAIGYNKTSVGKRAKKLGLGAKPAIVRKRHDNMDRELLVAMWTAGTTLPEMGKALDTNPSYVSRVALEMGLPSRKPRKDRSMASIEDHEARAALDADARKAEQKQIAEELDRVARLKDIPRPPGFTERMMMELSRPGLAYRDLAAFAGKYGMALQRVMCQWQRVKGVE